MPLDQPATLHWTGRAVGKNRMHTIARGRLIKTSKYRTFLDALSLTFRAQHQGRPMPGQLYIDIRITVGTRRDGQNLIDPVLDALEQGGIIENDRHLSVLRLQVDRHKQKDPDQIEVSVRRLKDETDTAASPSRRELTTKEGATDE